jgi:hypothetical protein
MVQPLWATILAIPQEIRHRVAILLRNSIPNSIPKKIENIFLDKNIGMMVHSNL